MYKNRVITAIVPAYNESNLIEKTLSSIPDYVDEVIVIDDGSKDDTYSKILKHRNSKIISIKHEVNRGVGAAISTGYKKFLSNNSDIAVVMAGDNQMDPDDLPLLLSSICEDKCDYAKGNRLYYKGSFKKIPKIRFFGNALLSLLTKVASGYWHAFDSQCGYTAIKKSVLKKINLDNIYPRYGFPNDLLIKLNCAEAKVIDVPAHPIYASESSGIKYWSFIPKVSTLLIRGFFWRLWIKHIYNRHFNGNKD